MNSDVVDGDVGATGVGVGDECPPRHLVLVAFLAIFVGMESVVRLVFGLFEDAFRLDFGFVGIVMGCGLLGGGQNFRFWSRVYVGLIICALGIGLVFLVLEWGDEIQWYVVVRTVLYMGCGVYAFVVLCRREAREWCEQEGRNGELVKRWKWVALVFSLLVAVSSQAHVGQEADKRESLYVVDTTIIVYDEVSGEEVSSFSLGTDDGEHDHLRYSSNAGGRISVSGYAYGEVKVRISHDEYWSEEVILDAESPVELRVGLRRIPGFEKNVENGAVQD